MRPGDAHRPRPYPGLADAAHARRRGLSRPARPGAGRGSSRHRADRPRREPADPLGARGRRSGPGPVLPRLVVPQGAGVLPPAGRLPGRGRGRLLPVRLDQRRPAGVAAAFRAGLGARWTFLCDADRAVQTELGLRESDRHPQPTPTCPRRSCLDPDLRIETAHNGYWFWGRPTNEEIRQAFRADHPADPARLGRPARVSAAPASWSWLALVAAAPADARAAAAVSERDGAPAGYLAVWAADERPPHGALRAWRAIFDPGGEAAIVSLVLVPPGRRLAFDDTAVQQARRAVLAGRPARGAHHPPLRRLPLRGGAHRLAGRPVARRARGSVRADLPGPAPAPRPRVDRPRSGPLRADDRALRERLALAGGPLREVGFAA